MLKPGSVIRFVKKRNYWVATQLPKVESSLVSMDPKTGAILALVGGFDFHRNKYNHVHKQIGSQGLFLNLLSIQQHLRKGIPPATLVNDAPIYITAKNYANVNGNLKNYNEKYDGAIRLSVGLAKSKKLSCHKSLKTY